MSGNSPADQSSRVVVIKGLTATKGVNIAGSGNIYDRRENKDGPSELPKSLQQAGATPSRTVLEFEGCQVGSDVNIGETNSYIDQTITQTQTHKKTRDVPGAKILLENQAAPMETGETDLT